MEPLGYKRNMGLESVNLSIPEVFQGKVVGIPAGCCRSQGLGILHIEFIEQIRSPCELNCSIRTTGDGAGSLSVHLL